VAIENVGNFLEVHSVELYTLSKNVTLGIVHSLSLPIINLTDFQNSFTDTLSIQLAIKTLLCRNRG